MGTRQYPGNPPSYPKLWRRVDQNTYLPLNVPNTSPPVQITSDLSPNFVDFYTTPFFFPPSGRGLNIVGDIGVPSGQTQQMYVESFDGGRTPQLSAFANLPFPAGSTLMRFWADERQGLPPFPPSTFGYFLAQVRRQLGSDFLYFALVPGGLGSQPPILSSGPIVQQIYGDFIRTQRGTFLVFAQATGTPATDTIFRSTDGGATWTRSTGVTELNPGLIECDDGTVLAPVSGAGVLRSTDDGQSFKPALSVSGVTVGLTWLKYFPGLNVLFAYVLQQAGSAPFGTAVYMSLDQGQTWAQVFTSATPARLGPQATSWMAVTGGTRSSVTQLLGVNAGCNIFSPQTAPVIAKVPPAPGSASAPYLGQFFFYSNNPEGVLRGLANNNLWLLRETVTGSGRVFFWHGNNVSAKLNSELLIYNPNSFSITVTATGGAVPLSGNGVDAWFPLFNGIAAAGSPLTIPQNSFGTLFVQTGLPLNNPFGVVANVNITDPNNKPAQATLFDVAWTGNFKPDTLNSSGQQAPKDGSTRVRGLAAAGSPPNNYGYWVPVVLNNFSIASILAGSTQGFTVAGANPAYFPTMTPDAFNGADSPFITDPDGSIAPLVGDYGTQLCITWPIANDDPAGVTHTVTFYAGSSQNLGNPTNFAIYYTGPGGCSGSFPGLNTNQYLAFLQDTIPPRTGVTYKFQIVTIGAFTYPLTLWVGVS